MNRIYLFLTIISFACLSASAQSKGESPYLFDEFQNATMHPKAGAFYQAKVNYNLAVGEFYFIDRMDGSAKKISSLQDIQTIKVGERVFHLDEKGVIEVLPTTPTLYVQYKGKVSTSGRTVGYGLQTETSSVDRYGGYSSDGGRVHLTDVNPENQLLSKRYNIYWVEKSGKKKAFKNLKQFVKIYSPYQYELQQYIEENHVNINDVQQISDLCTYVGTLQK